MADLIDRYALIKEISKYHITSGITAQATWNECVDIIIEELELFPSAQPEIIRCKDCKYMTEHYDTDGNVPYWTCSEWDSGTDYDGFCHYAEREVDE